MIGDRLIPARHLSAGALTGGGRDGTASRPALSATGRGKPAMDLRRSSGRNRGGCSAWGRSARDRGAAAVEFALVLPLLLLILCGIIDFGRALNAQITLTQAAREGARLAALGQPNVASRTQAAAIGLSPVSVTVTPCPFDAGPADDAVVQVSYSFSFITPIGAIAGLFGGSGLGSPISMSATGTMPCET